MNWEAAIERHRDALLGIVLMLFAVAGIKRGQAVAALPRRVRSMIARTLRAAEGACRRLVVIQARGGTVEDIPKRPAPSGAIPKGKGSADRLPSFPLFDKRKTFTPRRRRTGPGPRISFFDGSDEVRTVKPEPTPDDMLDAARLGRRLHALAGALEDLPKQAKRMIRAQAQRRHAPPGPRCVPPLRPGWPPGFRQRRKDPVDEILYQCHCLAEMALNPPRRLPLNMVRP